MSVIENNGGANDVDALLKRANSLLRVLNNASHLYEEQLTNLNVNDFDADSDRGVAKGELKEIVNRLEGILSPPFDGSAIKIRDITTNRSIRRILRHLRANNPDLNELDVCDGDAFDLEWMG